MVRKPQLSPKSSSFRQTKYRMSKLEPSINAMFEAMMFEAVMFEAVRPGPHRRLLPLQRDGWRRCDQTITRLNNHKTCQSFVILRT
jgi:hypothetical protein